MSEAKKEKMRAIKAELDNLVANSPVTPENALSPEVMTECLRLKWATRDSNRNFIPTEIGKAMAGRKDEE